MISDVRPVPSSPVGTIGGGFFDFAAAPAVERRTAHRDQQSTPQGASVGTDMDRKSVLWSQTESSLVIDLVGPWKPSRVFDRGRGDTESEVATLSSGRRPAGS